MNINATLVVQLISFFIAYRIIEGLLVRPAVALVQQDDNRKLKFEMLVKQQEQQLAQLVATQQARWRAVRADFARNLPEPAPTTFIPQQLPTITTKACDQQSVDALVAQASARIVTRVAL